MSNRKVIENYYNDISGLSDLLTKLVNSYRLLIGGAGELNGIALATRGDVKKALRRVDKLGDAIDDIICTINEVDEDYLKYCKIKKDAIKIELRQEFVEDEIEEELKK